MSTQRSNSRRNREIQVTFDPSAIPDNSEGVQVPVNGPDGDDVVYIYSQDMDCFADESGVVEPEEGGIMENVPSDNMTATENLLIEAKEGLNAAGKDSRVENFIKSFKKVKGKISGKDLTSQANAGHVGLGCRSTILKPGSVTQTSRITHSLPGPFDGGATVSVNQTSRQTHTLPGPFHVGASGQQAANIPSSSSHLPVLHTDYYRLDDMMPSRQASVPAATDSCSGQVPVKSDSNTLDEVWLTQAAVVADVGLLVSRLQVSNLAPITCQYCTVIITGWVT